MKFLLVDDNREDCLTTEGSLLQEFGENIEVEHAIGRKEALECLRVSEFDCILLDLYFGTDESYSFLEWLKRPNVEMPAALIIMSRSGSEEAAVSCLKRGAHDYITKSNLNSTFLRQVVTSALESYRLQQDLLKRQIELEQINKELGNKDKLKTHFVASASHELRTPVSAMFGLMDMLETTDLDSQQRRLMATFFWLRITQSYLLCYRPNSKVDIVLMDCQMPNMDGYEATEVLRQELKLTIPVIALTADAFQSQRERCLECGMDDVLVKPISADELDKYLRGSLKTEHR